MQMKTKERKDSGITLIALVVTIVVLLILAGVTITMVLGEGGILDMAKEAADRTNSAIANEQSDIAELTNQLANILNDGGSGETSPSTPPATAKTANDLTKDNYGDYVNYGINLDGDANTPDWRIFYVGDGTLNDKTEKRIYLIAADYVPNTCQELVEAKGENKANMTVNSSSGWSECTSLWDYNSGNPSIAYHCYDGHTKVSSVADNKEQCSFPELFMINGEHCSSTHYYCSDHVGTGAIGQSNANSRCASALQCTGNWSSFKTGAAGDSNLDSQYVEYAIGGPTLEMWVESWDQKHGDSDSKDEKTGRTLYVNGDNSSGTGYYVGVESTACTTKYYNLSSTTGYDDTLYFPHKTNQNLQLFNTSSPDSDGTASCYGYWLSSPSASSNTELMGVGFNGKVSNNGYSSNCGVRPVVCLKSDVKLTGTNDTFGDSVVWDLGK